MKTTISYRQNIFLLLLCPCLLLYSLNASSQDHELSQQQLDDILSTINNVQSKIQATQQERGSVQGDLLQTEKEILTLNQQVTEIEQQITTEEALLISLRQRSKALESEKVSQQALIRQYILSSYQTGREEYLKLLLNQQSIEHTSRTINYYHYFNQARALKVNTYNALLAELNNVQIASQNSNELLQLHRLELNQRQSTLTASQLERETLLTQLEASLDNSSTQLAKLKVERQQMEMLLDELQRTLAAESLTSQPFASLRGSMPWPSDGRLLNSFGSSTGQGDLNFEGVVIAGFQGNPVQSVHHGRVVFAEWFSTFGLLLIIDHGDGYMSLYGHNQSLYKGVGEWVTAGETVASIGNTGGRHENGVYFEIRHNGTSQDPINWCMARN